MSNESVLSRQEQEVLTNLKNNHERIHKIIINKKYLNDFGNLLNIKLDIKEDKLSNKDLFKELEKLDFIIQDIQVSIEDLEEGLFYKTVMKN